MTDKSQPNAPKQSTKVLQAQRRRRRQMLTYMRMVRYGINNFTRNAWLTIAATAVMTITLLIIFSSVAAQSILQDSVQNISEKVDMSIYLTTETTPEQADTVLADLRGLSNVRDVRFISSAQAREDAAEQNKDSAEYIEAINEATNKFPSTIRINLIDIDDTSQLTDFIASNQNVQQYLDQERDPSFEGDRRDAIQSIASWTVMAQRVGWIASSIFVIISSLIIFNTIRMAIFSRKEEIQMMKLIGADKRFIRGPFVVEAVVYGFIAALIATSLGYLLISAADDKFTPIGVDVSGTLSVLTVYIGFVVLAMIIIGAIIGVISSLLATRRYLKI